MARAAKASAAPQGKAAAAATPKAKGVTPAKVVTAKAPVRTAALAKVAKSKAPPPAPAVKAAKSEAAAPPPPAKPATVTLKHLAANLSDMHGLSRRHAESFATELVADLVDQIRAGTRVRVSGLGIFQVKDRPARMARNPATGASVQVAASRKVAFRVAKDLKEAI